MNANIHSQSNAKRIIRDVSLYGTLTYEISTPPSLLEHQIEIGYSLSAGFYVLIIFAK